MKVHLKVVKGKPLGASIALERPSYLIGRDVSCQIRPKHESVGPRHCMLSLRDGHLAIKDLGSSGGTLLNGRKLSPAEAGRAFHGDRIQVGNLVFEVSVAGFDAPREESELGEGDSPAAVLAGRILERNRAGAAVTSVAGGRRLRVQMLESVPVASLEMVRLDESDEVAAFGRELRALADRPGMSRLILDFRKVRSFSPEAAEVLAGVVGRMRARGAELKLCDVPPEVMEVLEEEGLTTRVFIGFDPHDALWSTW
jgi:predicted component of type VI protein secretion system